ncbi:hypothetical protein EV360DRAFT_75578 [Lentinula raphanica]|nr:hypothetical protein EV360DRAFT_75578 [Lentinula raphanica]
MSKDAKSSRKNSGSRIRVRARLSEGVGKKKNKGRRLHLIEEEVHMEQQVYRIYAVLSAFEESKAACISDMLQKVSNRQYLHAIRMAEKFLLCGRVLIASIDDLEFQFATLSMKGMSHVQEAHALSQDSRALHTALARLGVWLSQDGHDALATGLACYLKILIQVALTGAL